MNRHNQILNNKLKKIIYTIFMSLIAFELIIFFQNVAFYESNVFNLYYIVFVILLIYTLRLEYFALEDGNIMELIFVTVLLVINPVISIFEIFSMNYIDIPIFINVCLIIYKFLRREQ